MIICNKADLKNLGPIDTKRNSHNFTLKNCNTDDEEYAFNNIYAYYIFEK